MTDLMLRLLVQFQIGTIKDISFNDQWWRDMKRLKYEQGTQSELSRGIAVVSLSSLPSNHDVHMGHLRAYIRGQE
jgi:hypothetical protein